MQMQIRKEIVSGNQSATPCWMLVLLAVLGGGGNSPRSRGWNSESLPFSSGALLSPCATEALVCASLAAGAFVNDQDEKKLDEEDTGRLVELSAGEDTPMLGCEYALGLLAWLP